MLCLGLSGGLSRVHENPLELPGAFLHDGAAVLVQDGRVVAAVEEERLNRIKHSNKFPAAAIGFCLDAVGAKLRDIDRIGFYATETYCNSLLARLFAAQPDLPIPLDAKLLLCGLLEQEFRDQVDPSAVVFVGHHQAHAVSAFAMSGFDESLILAIDGYGDFLSGLVAEGHGTKVTPLETFPQKDSLGLFYLEVIRFLGYGPFDEYKVMGLAPYGDPSTFRELFSRFYEIHPDGDYRMLTERVGPALIAHTQVRRKGQPFTQQHKDVAAALQDALERIVFHVLRHRRQRTRQRRLCLAGGVAHNCTMNGKLLYSGLFEEVFVQPAAHDAGCALGAALMLSADLGQPARRDRLKHVYWGPALAQDRALERELTAWGALLDFDRHDDIAERAAGLIADGAVIGWAQGRSEFGPRALGNRSILADPRPAANKDRINVMVKKREAYRPFAPSVLEEDVHEFFDLPEKVSVLPFMIFVVHVREDKRELLGAITHVDGTARLQTVSRKDNPLYWELIHAFKARTGVPILLNTSFNNNAEPIVDSAGDAVTTFLTTGLDALVIGPYLARKRRVEQRTWLSLNVSLQPYVRLHQSRGFETGGRLKSACEIRTTFSSRFCAGVTPALFDALMSLDRECTVADLLGRGHAADDHGPMLQELLDLWAARLVQLHPTAATGKTSRPADDHMALIARGSAE
jgi:carbamoyltransferase